MRIIFHYDAGPKLAAKLSDLAGLGLEIDICKPEDDARFAELLPEAEVIWHVLRPLSRADIEAAPKLRLIQKIGVGVNTIDLDAARDRGVAVANMPGTNSRAVAELTLLLMLAALRRASALDPATRAGDGWSLGPALQETYGEIGGRTVGLVGYGAVPQLLAPVLTAMGADVIWAARSDRSDAIGTRRDLPDLLAEADIVSLHIPETPETRHLIDAEALAAMKPGAILVNTARGGLVDEAALVAALRDGRLAAAGLDVFAREPVDPANPLLALDNVVVLPHIAWLTPETLARSLDVAVENCRRLDTGEDLVHRVV